MGKHDVITMRADIPADGYYRDKIEQLEARLAKAAELAAFQTDRLGALSEENDALRVQLEKLKEAFIAQVIG